MHTVVILSENTENLLHEHKVLFAPFVSTGEISFCTWNVLGTDINTAVPDIYRTIKGKGPWRAVIIADSCQSIDPNGAFTANEQNPFDFSCNSEQEPLIRENPVPLVRLTHMLAGFPPLGIKTFKSVYTFVKDGKTISVDEAEMDKDEELYIQLSESGAGRPEPMYVEEEYPEQDSEIHTQLTKKYEFLDSRPSEVILIATYKSPGDDTKAYIKKCWENNLEGASSTFWKRNSYPNICRFILCHLVNPEHSEFEKNLFDYCLTVLTIATNRIPPSSLQAYRTYSAKVDVDSERLAEEINRHISVMEATRESVRMKMRQLPKYSFDGDESMLFKQDIPVEFDFAKTQGILEQHMKVGLSRNCPKDEFDVWNENVRHSKERIDVHIKRQKRAVDLASTYTHDRAESFSDDEYELDKFQIEDIKDTISELELDVLRNETRNLIDSRYYKKKIDEQSTLVRKQIARRMLRRTVVTTGLVMLLIFFAGFIPYLINAIKAGASVIGGALIVTLASLLLVTCGGIITLLVLRMKLSGQIKKYNLAMKEFADGINQNAKKFEAYFTKVCTYMKTYSVLRGVSQRGISKSSIRKMLRIHDLKLRDSIATEQKWCASYKLLLTGEHIPNASASFDPFDMPPTNPLYRLPVNTNVNDIMINEIGEFLTAPYSFIKKLRVERINLFDDEKQSDKKQTNDGTNTDGGGKADG